MKKKLIFILLCLSCTTVTPEKFCYEKATFWGLDKYSGKDGFPQYDIREKVCDLRESEAKSAYSLEDFVLFEHDSVNNRLNIGATVKRKLITTYTRMY